MASTLPRESQHGKGQAAALQGNREQCHGVNFFLRLKNLALQAVGSSVLEVVKTLMSSRVSGWE